MKPLTYLNKYIFKYKWRIIMGVIFICASNFFGVEMPKIVKNAVNDFIENLSYTKDFNKILFLSLKLAGIYLIFSILKGFFLFLTRQTIIIVSRYIEYDLKNEIFAHYQKLSYSFYKKNSTGDLMNRISEDVSQVRMYLGPGLMYTINLAILSIMAIYTMLKINVSLTLLVLTPLPIMSVLIYKVSSKMNFLSKEAQKEQSVMSTIVQETFSGIRVIKAYLREVEMATKFAASAENYKIKSMKQVRVNSLFMPTIVFLIGLSTLLAIYYGGILTYQKIITPGDIVAFIFYINMLTWPFASVGWVTSIIQRAAASQDRINEFLLEKPEINSGDVKLEHVERIVFSDVSFSYENEKVLKSINFELNKGEKIGFVGNTGAGKSTLLHLLMRQFDCSSGEITINDYPIKTLDINTYRSKVGVVPQEVFLFSDTIRNNILFGVSDKITEDEINRVTKQVHVYHNIVEFPDKFDTLLGERGVNLSGGQKQRLSIARALIRRPELLILDDCLSAVDTHTEDVILNSLNEINAMTIIVSHRVSSLRFVDRIYVLNKGEIEEVGTHDELMKRKGHYFNMYQEQLTKTEK
jgi:ATP-binding cassette subfamily B protein